MKTVALGDLYVSALGQGTRRLGENGQRHPIAAMAYGPIQQGRFPLSSALSEVAHRHSATNFQIALAWVLRRPGMVSIPKAASLVHVRANFAAGAIDLTEEDLAAIDTEFAPPQRKVALEML